MYIKSVQISQLHTVAVRYIKYKEVCGTILFGEVVTFFFYFFVTKYKNRIAFRK